MEQDASGLNTSSLMAFLETVHPYDSLPRDEMARVAASFSRRHYDDAAVIYSAGEPMTRHLPDPGRVG